MTPKAAVHPQLTIHLPSGEIRTIALEADRYDLGRDAANTLAFSGIQGLSRKHVLFERSGSDWTVRDLGSRNGTLVNGVPLAETRVLQPRDRISAGALVLHYADPIAASAAANSRTMLFVEKPVRDAAPAGKTVEATLETVLASAPGIHESTHMRALIQAGRELCGRTSLEDLFKVIIDLSIEAVGASRGVLITVESGEYHIRAHKGEGFQISTHVRDLVIGQKRSLLVQDALSDAALAARKSIVTSQIRGILAVPLQTERNVIGLIYLDSPVHIREFTKDDLNVLTVMANIAAIRIEQARLAEIEKAEMLRTRELEHAALIQRSIIPPDGDAFPTRGDFELCASMHPAKEVGGDLYDYFLLDEDRLGFVVGDVSGKGVPAALFMAVTRTLLRATAENQKQPGECFTYMNNSLAEGGSGMFVTLFYGVLNTRTGELAFANAGHNPPLIFSSTGEVRPLSSTAVTMLGIFPERIYKTLTTRLEPGEGILIYTDGVTEALNTKNEFFGEDKLVRYVAHHCDKNASDLVRGLQSAVQGFAEGTPQADDITVLVLRRRVQQRH